MSRMLMAARFIVVGLILIGCQAIQVDAQVAPPIGQSPGASGGSAVPASPSADLALPGNPVDPNAAPRIPTEGTGGTNQGPSAPPNNSVVPLPPTAPSAAAGPPPATAPVRPLPPTVTGGGTSVVNPMSLYGSASALAPRNQIPTIGTGAMRAPSMLDQKPFTGYSPGPVVSPYMNLYLGNNGAGIVNNYYSVVKPMLQQQNMNRQTEQSLRELRIQNRLQQSQLQQLNRQMPGAQGSSFMNYGGYYPSIGR